jgi:L1 cell adhesion molecule like protein
VTAADKATGKQSHVTITNEKGRLSHEEIEKMVNDAEQFKDEDKKVRERIEVKNGLESYCLNMKKLISDESLKNKLTDEDRKTIESET